MAITGETKVLGVNAAAIPYVIVIDESGNAVGSPTSAASAGIAPAQTATEASSLVVKNAPGNFYGASVTSAAAGYLMLFNAISAPADGTVTPTRVWAVAAGATFEASYPLPLAMSVGITLAFSSTGPFTKTAAVAFLSGEAV